MSMHCRCDAPGCDVEIDTNSVEYAMLGSRQVRLKGAYGWNYQDEAVHIDSGDSRFAIMGYGKLLGGPSAWSMGNAPIFHACSDEHLIEILKAAPTGATVLTYNRVDVKAAALAAVLVVMRDATEEEVRAGVDRATEDR